MPNFKRERERQLLPTFKIWIAYDRNEKESLHFLLNISDNELENRLLSRLVPLITVVFPSKLWEGNGTHTFGRNPIWWCIDFREALDKLTMPSFPLTRSFSVWSLSRLVCGSSKQSRDCVPMGESFPVCSEASDKLQGVAIIPFIPADQNYTNNQRNPSMLKALLGKALSKFQ